MADAPNSATFLLAERVALAARELGIETAVIGALIAEAAAG
jgi:nitroreductase